MYYSPRKTNITNYLESKDRQMRQLRSRLQDEKVSYSELRNAKKHLSQLKQSYQDLLTEDNSQLKKVVKSSTEAVSQLLSQKNSLIKQIAYRENELEELIQIKKNLEAKYTVAEQQLSQAQQKLGNVSLERQQRQNQILALQTEINQLRKGVQIEKEIEQEIYTTEKELQQKMNNAQNSLQQNNQQVQNLEAQIERQLKQINNLEHELNSQQLRLENLTLKLQNQQKINQNYQHRLQIAQNQIQKNIEDKYLLINQESTENNLKELIQTCLSNTAQKQKEHANLVEQTSKIQKQLENQTQKLKELQEKCELKEGELRELKQKNELIRGILNSIFSQDSQVLKMIASKKVYPTANNQKQNIPIASEKPSLQSADTSDNFFSVAKS